MVEKKSRDEIKKLKWHKTALSWVGFIFTLIYLPTLYYIETGDILNLFPIPLMIEKFKALPANGAGDFLAGIFAPLAFLWLVIGYFQNNIAIQIQSEELTNTVKEMEEANKTSKGILQSQEANELHARKDTFFRYYDVAKRELDALTLSITQYIATNSYEQCNGSNVGAEIHYPGHKNISLLLIGGAQLIIAKIENNSYIKTTASRQKPDIVKSEIYRYISVYTKLECRAKKI